MRGITFKAEGIQPIRILQDMDEEDIKCYKYLVASMNNISIDKVEVVLPKPEFINTCDNSRLLRINYN